MARGRKKDLTIPPSRSIVQQRNYRDRRQQYITSLEERCRRIEEENIQLRKELAEARECLVNPAVLLPETAAASSDLMHQLSSARDALAKFNQLVFPNTQGGEGACPDLNRSTSSSYHRPDSVTPPSTHPYNDSNTRSRKVDEYSSPFTFPSSSPATMAEDPLLNCGECCGGILDCEELCEDEDNQSFMTLSRTSGMRSTTA